MDDPGEMHALGVSVYEHYYGEYRGVSEGPLHKRVVVDRTVSWDHRKLIPRAG